MKAIRHTYVELEQGGGVKTGKSSLCETGLKEGGTGEVATEGIISEQNVFAL